MSHPLQQWIRQHPPKFHLGDVVQCPKGPGVIVGIEPVHIGDEGVKWVYAVLVDGEKKWWHFYAVALKLTSNEPEVKP